MTSSVGVSPVSPRLTPNPYGHFDLETKSFVITDVLTPKPWANVMSNDRYGLVLSQAGGGFSWYENCQIFRVSRWEQDLVRDDMGRFVYVQDLANPEELWSTTYQPTRRRAEEDRVTHGLGFTTFERSFLSLEVSQTVFVPNDGACEVWLLKVRNKADRARNLRLASYLELHLGGIGDWHREFHRLFTESKIVENTLVAWKHPGLPEHQGGEFAEPVRVAFAWHGDGQAEWVTDKADWLGRCGSPDRPQGLTEKLTRSETPRWDDPIAAGMIEFVIGPGEERTFTYVIAAGTSEKSVIEEANRYDVSAAEAALAETKAFWLSRCQAAPVKAPDEATDLMVNGWLPYQTIAGRLNARCAYYQQGGAYGYRDQLQDSLALLESEPERTLEQLLKHAAAMYPDGHVRHWWHPDTNIFQESRHSDTCLWLAYGVADYLTTTGNYEPLSKIVSYLESSENGTLLDHCRRGIDRALRLRSPRGLPLIGAGDWNDGLSHAGLQGKGESVWLGMFLFDVLQKWAAIYERLGLVADQRTCLAEADSLRHAVNEYGWDGEWYLEGTRDDGGTLGSRQDAEGALFLNPQTWAVLSGIAPADRVEKCMTAVKKHLVKPYGALLLNPAFSICHPYVGYITRYAPGLRENGGVYSHASTWAVLAFLKMGDRETAEAIFRGMLPPLRSVENADLYAAEPYVMPGNIDGPDSAYEGRAGWTWYTGSAAWMCRVARALYGAIERESA